MWIEGKTALLLADVVRYGDGYRVTSAADGKGRTTTFDVNEQRLLITHKDGARGGAADRPAVTGETIWKDWVLTSAGPRLHCRDRTPSGTAKPRSRR